MIEIFAQSEAMREAMRLAERVAATDANVLVTGESGAGKDALALHIHSHSSRASQPFVKIDCATLPSDLLEAELFGYERGAFTSATEAKPGRLEAADKGTIVLDNVRELANTIERAVIIATGNRVEVSDLPEAIRAAVLVQRKRQKPQSLAEVEAEYVAETLAATRGNKTEAVRILRISRKNLYERLARLRKGPGDTKTGERPRELILIRGLCLKWAGVARHPFAPLQL